MRDVVREAFVPLTIAFEGGYIGWMFPDVKGLVSTGFGLLLDPVAMALGLPWRRSDGSLATREEVVADFYNVKNHPNAARLGHKSVEKVAKLRLDREGLFQAFQGKLNSNERVLRKGFPNYDEWPADAELAIHSQSWAVGPAFYNPGAGRNYWPRLTAAIREKDWRLAATECFLKEEKTISGLRPRNRANALLFNNAAIVAAMLDPDKLYYPTDLNRPLGPDDETVEEEIPQQRPSPHESTLIHPDVPLGRPALDDDGGPPDDAA